MVSAMEDNIQKLEAAVEVADIFQLVKECVRESLGRGRAGLMLGLSPLGFSEQGFIGAYHQIGSNLLVLNSSLLKKVEQEKPEMLKYYTFHLLLHEYLHSLGVVEEERARAIALLVSKESFGEGHVVAQLAESFEKFLPNMQYPGGEFKPPEQAYVTLVQGFDREATSYIG